MYRLFLLPLILILSSCKDGDQDNYHDPDLKLTATDFKTKLIDRTVLNTHKPMLRKLIHPAEPFPKQFNQHVSISICQAIPLKDILLALAQQAKVNIIVANNIEGGSSLHISNRPLIQVIQEICESYNLRYRIKGTIIKIERDTPFMKNYNVQFLVMTRGNQNRFSIATDVFTAPHGSQTLDDNGSNTTLTGNTKTDFWAELTQNLEIILQSDTSNTDTQNSASRFTIHKQGGLITVIASESQHKVIQSYLNELRHSVEQQVLIEAKIVEVTLDDQFKSGINWNIIQGDFSLKNSMGRLGSLEKLNSDRPFKANIFSVGVGSEKISGIINLLDQFGTVRTLCNPRLTVINNQSAVLKSAENKVYFKLNSLHSYNYNLRGEQVQVSSDIKTVPIGLMIVVHPTINKADGKIIMTLRPSISRIVKEVEDPAVSIASKQQQRSYVPEIQVRELDSVLAMNSGETIIMGGLMEELGNHDVAGVPGLQDLPFGAVFKSTDHQRKVTELVVFLKATIIESDSISNVQNTSVSNADQQLYQNFIKDNRPINFDQ